MTDHEEAVRQVAEVIDRIKIAMLTTITEEGALRSRPVTTQGARFDGVPRSE
jgi:general stress protein 26